MLEKLKRNNPDIPFFDVFDPAFAEFGAVITDLDTAEIVAAAQALALPQDGSLYTPSEPSFEALPIAAQIRDRYFGTLPTQVGYCCGHSNFLNAAEWHASNEINVAVTPLVLLLGNRSRSDEELHASDMKAFFVPAGTALEIWSTTLHFCPCEVQVKGFGCVVALPKGTNTPLDAPSDDKLLFRKNKWIVAHNQNQALIDRGVLPGIDGINYQIHY